MLPRTFAVASLALTLVACRRHEEPRASHAPAQLALAQASQADLARELDDAERRGTWREVRTRWQGQHLRWTVTRQRALCQSAERCNVAVFPIERPAQHGWLPALAFAPGEWGKLETACGTAPQCDVTIEGTLKQLEVSAEMPASVHLADVRVVSRG
jgi:hypothetical protein